MATETVMKNQSGQTAIEYIFILVIMISIIGSLFSILKNYYLGDLSKCDNPSNEKLLLCKINAIVAPNSSGVKKFQYYYFKK